MLNQKADSEQQKTKQDPVCLMNVDINRCKFIHEFHDTIYYFCCESCVKKFTQDPLKYLNKNLEITPLALVDFANPDSSKQSPYPTHNNTYTCPMHPTISSSHPANCPSCGMALESNNLNTDFETNLNLKYFIGSLIATIPLVILDLICKIYPGLIYQPLHNSTDIVELIFTSLIIFFAAKPLLKLGLDSINNKCLNMFTLLSLGIIIPYLVGFGITITKLLNIQTNQMPAMYFLTSITITAITWLGQYLEAKARSFSSNILINIQDLLPNSVTIINANGQDEKVSLDQIQPGDKLRIKPGEKLPCDGIVLSGETTIDESLVTGEALPSNKTIDSQVYSGSVNGYGSIIIKASKVGDNTLLAQIFAMVSYAKQSQIPIQSQVDKIAAVFTPLVIIIAIITFLVNASTNPIQALLKAISVLVIACPCALGLATPISIMIASGLAAKSGILFNNVKSLQTLAKVNTIIFDKTGTLTQGKPKLTNIELFDDLTADDVLALIYSVELQSEHPLANAIITESQKRNLNKFNCHQFKACPGAGIEGIVNNKHIIIGSYVYLQTHEVTNLPNELVYSSQITTSSVLVSINKSLVARLDFNDEVRNSAEQAIKGLKQLGLNLILASGDNAESVNSLSLRIGIPKTYANLMPQAKYDLVERLKNEGKTVAMVGDGINDAPALALANVSIALSTGSNLAINTADLILINGNLTGITKTIKLSKALLINIGENLFLAFAYNIIAIAIASGLFSNYLVVTLNPMIACLTMSLSSILVIANANTLKLIYPKL